MGTQAVVSTKNIVKSYGKGNAVLHGADMTVQTGEFVAITGPSGSGKSTLVRILGLLDQPSGGTLELFGTGLPKGDRALSRLRNEAIGFVFQDYRLVPHYSVLENVCVPLKINGISPRKRKKRASELLKLVGLGDVLERKASDLSGGQQQRAGIARAIAMQPKLLIADEPTGNLDSETGEKILKILTTIHKSLGTTLIVVTHSETVAKRADRIIRMQDGRLIG